MGMGYAAIHCSVSAGIIFLVHSRRLMHPTRHKVTHTIFQTHDTRIRQVCLWTFLRPMMIINRAGETNAS